MSVWMQVHKIVENKVNIKVGDVFCLDVFSLRSRAFQTNLTDSLVKPKILKIKFQFLCLQESILCN